MCISANDLNSADPGVSYVRSRRQIARSGATGGSVASWMEGLPRNRAPILRFMRAGGVSYGSVWRHQRLILRAAVGVVLRREPVEAAADPADGPVAGTASLGS
jgi:hypothetical protein